MIFWGQCLNLFHCGNWCFNLFSLWELMFPPGFLHVLSTTKLYWYIIEVAIVPAYVSRDSTNCSLFLLWESSVKVDFEWRQLEVAVALCPLCHCIEAYEDAGYFHTSNQHTWSKNTELTWSTWMTTLKLHVAIWVRKVDLLKAKSLIVIQLCSK